MRNSLRVYLKCYDVARFFTQASRGYVVTKFTPAQFGRFPNVRGKVKFHIRGEAVFGERFTALGEPVPVRIAVAEGARLTVGDHVAMNCSVSIDVWHDVRIGCKVMIAPNVTIVDDNRHELEPGAPLHSGPITIGDNVWIAGNVTILSGVTIGSGSVIASHSVVTRDIPPNCLAGGSPARGSRASTCLTDGRTDSVTSGMSPRAASWPACAGPSRPTRTRPSRRLLKPRRRMKPGVTTRPSGSNAAVSSIYRGA